MTTTTTSRFYVRGTEASHEYDPEVTGRRVFCLRCQVVHARPLGKDWHIETDEVDLMACGVRITLDDGEVRETTPKNVCAECARSSP